MRNKPLVKYDKKVSLTILMDERYDRLDCRMARVIFSAVELPGEAEDVAKIMKIFSRLKKQTNEENKFHFTDMDPSAKEKVINAISKLDIKCKMYILYAVDLSESRMKNAALAWAVKNTRKSLSKRYVLNVLIEDAEQYKGVIRVGNLTNDSTITVIPDAFCYTFARRLDSKPDAAWYDKIKNKIRLESYWIGGEVFRKKREGKLIIA